MTPFEQSWNHDREDELRAWDAALPFEPIGDPAGAIVWLDDAFVKPNPLARHRRTLEETPSTIDLDEADVVVVDGQHPKEKNPASKRRLT